MKHKKSFWFLSAVFIFVSVSFFAKNSEGHHGVGEFDLQMSIEEFSDADVFHIKKSVVEMNGGGHARIVMSDNPSLSCTNKDTLILDDTQKVLSLDIFSNDEDTIEYGRYERNGLHKLGPSIRTRRSEVLFGGMDVGHVEIVDVNTDDGFITGEIAIRDIKKRTLSGNFEAVMCE